MSLADAKITDSMINDHFREMDNMLDFFGKTETPKCQMCGKPLDGFGDDTAHEMCADCARLIKSTFKTFVKANMECLDFDDTAEILLDYAADVLTVKSAYTEEEKAS